jgi:hypothetical protein
VPEALPRTLVHVKARFGVEALDRLWIFPPRRRGRREQGLVAVSVFLDGQERRALYTVSYRAERTGRSLTVDPVFTPEGDAPPESLPRVMEGVVRRSGETEDPREVPIEGSEDSFDVLMAEFDPGLLEVEQA